MSPSYKEQLAAAIHKADLAAASQNARHVQDKEMRSQMSAVFKAAGDMVSATIFLARGNDVHVPVLPPRQAGPALFRNIESTLHALRATTDLVHALGKREGGLAASASESALIEEIILKIDRIAQAEEKSGREVADSYSSSLALITDKFPSESPSRDLGLSRVPQATRKPSVPQSVTPSPATRLAEISGESAQNERLSHSRSASSSSVQHRQGSQYLS